MSATRTSIFLHKSINTLPNDAQFNAIRSQMMLKCRRLLNITQDDFWHCTVCGVNLKEIIPHRDITPTHYNKIRFLKRQLKKDECYRTKYQALYIKKFVKRYYDKQQVITTVCQRCKKQYKAQIAKPKLVFTSKTDLESRPGPIEKSKKKKKKKKNAGLKESAVLEAKQHLINSNTELEKSPNYYSLDSPKTNNIIIINDSPKLSDNVTPVSNKKAHKSKSKFDPTNHSPKIVTKQDNEKINGTFNNLSQHFNAFVEPFKGSKRKRQDFVEETPTVVLQAMKKKKVNKSKKMNALTELLNKMESTPPLKSTLETFLQNV